MKDDVLAVVGGCSVSVQSEVVGSTIGPTETKNLIDLSNTLQVDYSSCSDRVVVVVVLVVEVVVIVPRIKVVVVVVVLILVAEIDGIIAIRRSCQWCICF